jgi:hypothetical protein
MKPIRNKIMEDGCINIPVSSEIWDAVEWEIAMSWPKFYSISCEVKLYLESLLGNIP